MGTLSTNPKKSGFTGLFCGSFNPVQYDPHNSHIVHTHIGKTPRKYAYVNITRKNRVSDIFKGKPLENNC